MRVSELTIEEARRWNIFLRQALFSNSTIEEISKIHIKQFNFHNFRDNLKWFHHSNGIFFVKSAYAAIVSNSHSQHPPHIWKKL